MWKSFKCNVKILTAPVWLWSKYMKIQWKFIIDQKFRLVFQISRPANIPQKWFSTLNEPLDVSFQMRLTPTMDGSDFWRKKKQAKTTVQSFKNTLKHCIMVTVFFSPKIKSPHGWGQSHLKPDIQRFVLSTEPFLRDIIGLRYLKNNSELLVND